MFNKWKNGNTFHPIEHSLIKEIKNKVGKQHNSLIDNQINNVVEISRDIISKGKYYTILIFGSEDGQFPDAANVQDYVQIKLMIDGSEASVKVNLENGFLFYFEFNLSKGKLKPNSTVDSITEISVKNIANTSKILSPACEQIINSNKFKLVSGTLTKDKIESYKNELSLPVEYWEFMFYCSSFNYGKLLIFSPESTNHQEIQGLKYILFGQVDTNIYFGVSSGGEEIVEYDAEIDELFFTNKKFIDYIIAKKHD
ncbi:MAG: hypothetical protein NE327_06650 [Lentisphaeraceae bacterium]|nr:hypothetical protein [Lentisphaeraceae bacterium]